MTTIQIRLQLWGQRADALRRAQSSCRIRLCNVAATNDPTEVQTATENCADVYKAVLDARAKGLSAWPMIGMGQTSIVNPPHHIADDWLSARCRLFSPLNGPNLLLGRVPSSNWCIPTFVT